MSAIIMSELDRQKYLNVLMKYYLEKGKTEEEAKLIIDDVFVQCQMGWPYCPKDLDTRIKIKTGFQWVSHENLRPRKKKEIIIEKSESDDIINDQYIDRYLTPSEKKWWEQREEVYKKEFEFNNSSDYPLLMQLLFEELMQRRLFISQLKNPNNDYGKVLTESLKRVVDLQVKLGITREQRAGVIDNVDGNIADLSITLEEKLLKIPDIERKEREEELMYGHFKSQRPPVNILPPKEKIEAILQSGDYEEPAVREEIAEEVTKETKKEDLPMGEEI